MNNKIECSFHATSESLGVHLSRKLSATLRPHYQNFNKRLVKTPKLYFYDTSIVCHLLGIESIDHLQLHVQRGAIFEGFVITELLKKYFARGKIAGEKAKKCYLIYTGDETFQYDGIAVVSWKDCGNIFGSFFS